MWGQKERGEPQESVCLEWMKHHLLQNLPFSSDLLAEIQQYLNVKNADMHLIYKAANSNAIEAARLYQERFPNKAAAHFLRTVQNYMDIAFPNREIGLGEPVVWSPRSPNLSSLDFFSWYS
ncbi:hypothetical protein AVEN_202121-1 [Araneus ventricosus]|uniref:DUF4817 domain-containing protein n=1 Tax=Araneus ventricosus TaxID=182803 RepID=A0A4Y2E1J6_ARAVE|nr:hypothetical protein AVEN_202121-1 [Araneus ventricosus]